MALAVVALALSAIVKAASDNVVNAAYLRDKTLAHWVAMNQVARLQLSGVTQPLGRRDGAAEMAGRRWFWRVTVVGTADPDTRRLEVEVRADEDRDDPLVRLIAFLAS